MNQRRLFTARQRKALHRLSGNACALCASPLPKIWHADHKEPFSLGGKTDIENAQPTCPQCNLRKSNRSQSDTFDSKADQLDTLAPELGELS